jgi:DNA-binding MarR family transcriptional regulator
LATRPPQMQMQSSLASLLLQTFQCLIQDLVSRLEASGYPDIRASHSRVFEHLPLQGARISDLADRAQMTQQSMSELVAHLVQRGYLERQADPDDGRARIVRLTQAGERLSATGRTIIRDVEREWGDRIGEERMALLRLTLQEVLEGCRARG